MVWKQRDRSTGWPMRAKRGRRAGWRVMRGAGESMPSSFRSDRGRIGSLALSTNPNKLNSVIEWSDYNAVRFPHGPAPPRRKAEEYRNIVWYRRVGPGMRRGSGRGGVG